MANRQDEQTNYLDFVPRRAIDSEPGEAGRVVLLHPRFATGLAARILQPRIKNKYYRVRLDELGSATWEAIDGRRTVQQICDLLFERFGEDVEPRYQRCPRFISTLHESAMITLDTPAPSREG